MKGLCKEQLCEYESDLQLCVACPKFCMNSKQAEYV